MHDVAVLNYVFLTFYAELSGSAAGSLRLECHEVLVLDDLSTDESLFEVCVNYSSGLRSLISLIDSP